jgi:hypothetical protein
MIATCGGRHVYVHMNLVCKHGGMVATCGGWHVYTCTCLRGVPRYLHVADHEQGGQMSL